MTSKKIQNLCSILRFNALNAKTNMNNKHACVLFNGKEYYFGINRGDRTSINGDIIPSIHAERSAIADCLCQKYGIRRKKQCILCFETPYKEPEPKEQFANFINCEPKKKQFANFINCK
jgi:hypothetical protein